MNTSPEMLNVNVLHLRQQTVHFLDARVINKRLKAITVTPVTHENNTPAGWHIVIDKDEFDKSMATDDADGIPHDLGVIILYAIDHGHDELIISYEGKTFGYIPRYVYLAHDQFSRPGIECCYCGPALLTCNILNPYIQLSMSPAEDTEEEG